MNDAIHENLSPREHWPFPISHGYRQLAAVTEPQSLGRAQGGFTENLLTYLCGLSLALVDPSQRSRLALEPHVQWGRPMSLGHWRDLLARVLKVVASNPGEPLSKALVSLAPGSDRGQFGSDIQWLISYRNRLSHSLDLTEAPDRLAQECQAASAAIDRCMMELSFLSQYPLRLLESCKVRRDRPVVLQCKSYMGDHPIHDAATAEYPTPLPEGELYVELQPDRWASLHPFIRVATCPDCSSPETYFVDRWDKGREVYEYKSFERRHSLAVRDVDELLVNWVTGESSEANVTVTETVGANPTEDANSESAPFEVSPGDVVSVIDGPFAGYSVEVVEVGPDGIEGWLSLYGSPTYVKIEASVLVPGGDMPIYQSALSLLTAADKKLIEEAILEVLGSSGKPLKAKHIAPKVHDLTGLPMDRSVINHFLRVPGMKPLVEQGDHYCWSLK
jgi:hypothetical protein